MNADDAIQQFCRKNYKILTSRELTKLDYKDLVKSFFYEQHSNRFGQPSLKDVQFSLVSLLHKNGLGSAKITEIINNGALFSETSDSVREELLRTLIAKSYTSDLTPDQIQTIKQVGAYKALEITKGQEIEHQKQTALEVLNKQIEDRRQEYESLPSVLEQEPVLEPDFQQNVEETKLWWERFYLKSDPFPRKDGLSSIAEDMYEAIISKTKPFTDTLSTLEKNPTYLFHTGFLLVGGYGYGKTTFIDYLSHYLINAGILPLRISCTRCSADASGFADSFFHRLRKTLLDEAQKITHVDQSLLSDLEVEDQVTELIKMITSRKKGVIIFMDDYHKHASHFPQIYEFLGTLQVIKDSLTRMDLPAGFVVSGIPEWKDELGRNSQLSGFLDSSPIEMPDVNAALVCEVFNKRIKAYCYEGTPRLIKSDFVEKLVREFAGKAGLRDYIGKIVTELSHNNYAIVDSPIEIAEETLAEIRNILEADSHLKTGITKLVYSSAFKRFNQEQVAKTLELLVHVGTQGGITETDKQFSANRFYFQTLKDCGLIQKQRTTTGSLSWGIHTRLRKVANQVQAKYGLSLHDYVLKIYAYKAYGTNSRNIPESNLELDSLKQFFGNPELKLTTSVSENIALGLRVLETLSANGNGKAREANALESAKAAIDAFSEALFTLDGGVRYFQHVSVKDTALQWELHPNNDETLTEAFARYRDYHAEKTSHRLALALKQTREAAYLVANALKSLLEEQTLRSGIPLLHRPLAHTEEEIRIFEAAIAGKYSTLGQDHFDYIRRVTDLLELRFRSFLYLVGNLLFGQNYIEQCPKQVVAYAYKSLETRVVFNTIENRFDGLTRSQYRQIFCEGNAYKINVIDNLTLEWKQSDWDLFGELFAEINIETAHLQVAAFDVTNRTRYLRYCALAEEITAAMNTMTSALIAKSVYLCQATSSSRKPEDVLIKYDLRALRPKDVPEKKICSEWPKSLNSNAVIIDHVITQEIYDRVYRRLVDKIENSPNGLVVIDMLNIDYLADHYRTSMTEFANSLAFLAHIDRTLIVRPWMGSSIVITRPGAELKTSYLEGVLPKGSFS